MLVQKINAWFNKLVTSSSFMYVKIAYFSPLYKSIATIDLKMYDIGVATSCLRLPDYNRRSAGQSLMMVRTAELQIHQQGVFPFQPRPSLIPISRQANVVCRPPQYFAEPYGLNVSSRDTKFPPHAMFRTSLTCYQADRFPCHLQNPIAWPTRAPLPVMRLVKSSSKPSTGLLLACRFCR